MNRLMVCLGLGSLLFLGTTRFVSAEYPVSIQGASGSKMASMVTWHTDLQSGWREAKRRNVPMVIFITMEPCVYCDAMKRDTWCNQDVQNRMAGNFVAIRLNKMRNSDTLSRISVGTYPTTLLGTPNGKVVGHRLGYQPPDKLQAFLSEAKTLVGDKVVTPDTMH